MTTITASVRRASELTPSPDTPLLSSRVNEEPGIKAKEKSTSVGVKERLAEMREIRVFIVAFFVGWVPLIFLLMDIMGNGSLHPAWTTATTVLSFGIPAIFMAFVLFMPGLFHEKRKVRIAIKKSRKAAQTLGSDLVPVLTEDHIEARVRVDDALRQQIEQTKNSKWSQEDSDRIGLILFQDLNRERIIISLITDRGLLTAHEVGQTLLEIESNTAKPIEDGWL